MSILMLLLNRVIYAIAGVLCLLLVGLLAYNLVTRIIYLNKEKAIEKGLKPALSEEKERSVGVLKEKYKENMLSFEYLANQIDKEKQIVRELEQEAIKKEKDEEQRKKELEKQKKTRKK